MQMKFHSYTIGFQECPNEISLIYSITNCPYRCDGCHTPELQEDIGEVMTIKVINNHIKTYLDMITCIIFFGGDHHPELVDFLKHIKEMSNLKTGLWTGSDIVNKDIMSNLDFLKTGQYDKTKYMKNRSLTSNQKYINIKTGQEIIL